MFNFVKKTTLPVEADEFMILLPVSKWNGFDSEQKIYFNNAIEVMNYLLYGQGSCFHGSVYFKRGPFYYFGFEFDKRYKKKHGKVYTEE